MQPPRKQPETGLYAPVWAEMNRLIDYVRSITIYSGRGLRLTRGVNGTTLSAEFPSRESGVQQFRLESIQNDFYTCRKWNGTEVVGNEVYIARPFTHRVSNFNGQTIAYNSDGDAFSASYTYASATKRTKTIAGAAETQVLIPLFKTGFDLIYAVKCDQPLTAGPANTPITDPNDSPITLLDLNLEGRAWSKV